MSVLTRFGISLDSELLEQFDELIRRKGYQNRSEAIRDLIREKLIHHEWDQSNGEQVGTVTLIYDHHTTDITDKLTKVEHDYCHQIVSNMHVHLDHDNCLEVLAVKGSAIDIQRLADALIALKGIKHGKLVASTMGRNLN